MSKEEQDKMIIDNIPLIYKVIKDLHLFWNTEDEFQEYYDFGLEGLIKGVKSYNPAKYKLSTFLYICIKNMILRCIQLSEMQCRKIHKTNLLSLNTTLFDDFSETISEIIADDRVNIEDEIEQKIKMETVIKAIDLLENKTDALVVKMYYEIDGYSGGTYENISKQMHVTKSSIGFRVKRAIPKIKEKVEYIERNGLMLQEANRTIKKDNWW